MTDGFNISYFTPGDFAAGDWAHDVVTPEHDEGPNPLGVMGLSLSEEEQNPLPSSGAAGTVLDSLLALDVIGRRSFGLYLDDIQASKGSFCSVLLIKRNTPVICSHFRYKETRLTGYAVTRPL